MPLYIVRDDIANMRADAIVVPANPTLWIDGGAGEAVARIAGVGISVASFGPKGLRPIS